MMIDIKSIAVQLAPAAADAGTVAKTIAAATEESMEATQLQGYAVAEMSTAASQIEADEILEEGKHSKEAKINGAIGELVGAGGVLTTELGGAYAGYRGGKAAEVHSPKIASLQEHQSSVGAVAGTGMSEAGTLNPAGIKEARDFLKSWNAKDDPTNAEAVKMINRLKDAKQRGTWDGDKCGADGKPAYDKLSKDDSDMIDKCLDKTGEKIDKAIESKQKDMERAQKPYEQVTRYLQSLSQITTQAARGGAQMAAADSELKAAEDRVGSTMAKAVEKNMDTARNEVASTGKQYYDAVSQALQVAQGLRDVNRG